MSAGRSALIIATSTYADPRLPPLSGPAKDATALKAVLGSDDIGGFEVKTLLNATSTHMRETLEAFFTDRAREDLLVISVSCHGLKDDDGQLFLAASDTKLDRLMSTGIDADWVNRLMDRCRSERIAVFLDCCFAGAFTSGMTRRAAGESAGVKDKFTGRGTVVITASDAMQYAFEGGQQVGEPPGPSPFTQALVDGLRTGEADRDEDGNVSINELFDFLEQRVRESSPSQTPTKSAVNQTGDWVIARSTRVPSVQLLPERVQQLLKSRETIDRLEAIIDLERIRSSTDERMSQAATGALETLTSDDSRRVAQRATEVLSGDIAPPAATSPGFVPMPHVAPTPPITITNVYNAGVEEVGQEVNKVSAPHRAGIPPFGLDMIRGAARALLGSFIGIVMAAIFALSSYNSGTPATSQEILGAIVGVVVGSTVVATVIEFARLRLRFRSVRILRAVATNRWAEAATVGVVVSLVAAVLNEGGGFERLAGVAGVPVTLVLLVVTQIGGFLIAESVVGSARPHAAPGSAAG